VTEPAWAIRADHVSKQFSLFTSPRQRLLNALGFVGAQRVPVFRALDDVSFEVAKGSTIGIVGRNGSGKSTLLQIICGILRPTTGAVAVDGRLSAILDLGGGFNPELTGRENVRLRYAVLGIARREMESRLGDIEAFADIGAFFDRPIKIYSSGMFVRLAFAAAINTEPDVLLIDEALAVGDAKFQHKCFRKIHDLRMQGKTIALVTHNTEAVVRHCDSAYLLENGTLLEHGSPREIVNSYLELLFTGRLSSYCSRPTLIQAGVLDFNIIHFRRTYYALASTVGPLDLELQSDDDLARLEVAGQLVRGTLADIKARIGAFTPARSSAVSVSVADGTDEPRSDVGQFLEEVVTVDRCGFRASYNHNERRIGDRRGAIVDYLIVSDTGEALFSANTGETLHIYLKARFFAPVEAPMFGLSLKTKDGIVVHASNSRYCGLVLDAAGRDETVVFSFSLSCMLHPGDYFLDLGLAEMQPDTDLPIDIRYGVVHLVVQSQGQFDGLVNLSTGAREATRLADRPNHVRPAS
jgi:lipopolysaccharide transport system ATP-binding protein